MCPDPNSEPPWESTNTTTSSSEPLGIPASETQLALQTDVCKEMVNKIAWVLGSSYRKPYSNMRSPARAYAWRIVKTVLRDHGYPGKIAK